jgi:hypothetical protein
MAVNKENKQTNTREAVEKKEPSYIVGENANSY